MRKMRTKISSHRLATCKQFEDKCINQIYHRLRIGESMATVRFIFLFPIILLTLLAVPFVYSQPNSLITQTVIVQTINYSTGLPLPASVTVAYTCSNPDGSWTPYSLQGWANPPGATFQIVCHSPSTFNSWIHVYGQNGYWWGTADYRWIPSQGGAPVSLVVALLWTNQYNNY